MPNPNLGASRGSYVARVRVRGTYRPKPPLFRAWWPPPAWLGPPFTGSGLLGSPPPFVGGGRRGPGLLGPCWLPGSLRWACSPQCRPLACAPQEGHTGPWEGTRQGPQPCKPQQGTASQHRTGRPRDKTGQGAAPSTRHATHATRDSPGHPTPHKPTTEPRNTHKRPMHHHVCAISGGLFRALGRVVPHRAFCCFCPTYVRSYAPWLGLGMVT